MVKALFLGMLIVLLSVAYVIHMNTESEGHNRVWPMEAVTTSAYVECVTMVANMDMSEDHTEFNTWVDTLTEGPQFSDLDYAHGVWLTDGRPVGYALSEDSKIMNEKICLL